MAATQRAGNPGWAQQHSLGQHPVCIGSEQSIHLFFDWLVKLARSRPQKTDQMGQFWLTTAWRLVMEMRAGKTFDETVAALMKDYDAFPELEEDHSDGTLAV